MTAAKAAWTAFAIGAVLILTFYVLQNVQQNVQSTAQRAGAGAQTSSAVAAEEQAGDETGAQAEGSQATATTEPTLDSPAGVDRGNGFAQVSPDADQAPPATPDADVSGQPTPAPVERKEIIAPPIPTPDMQDPTAVAGAFLTVYNSRTSETDESWKSATQAWLVPDLVTQLPLVPNGALEGKTPAAVRTVEVGGNVADWGIDTPLRWAHHVQVTVDTQDQGTYLLEYRLRAQLTDQGWLINAAPLDSWQRVEG